MLECLCIVFLMNKVRTEHMKFLFIKLLFMILIGISLTACGVKSVPIVPEGGTYPAQYPPPLAPIEETPRVLKENNPPAFVIQAPNSFWQYPNTRPAK